MPAGIAVGSMKVAGSQQVPELSLERMQVRLIDLRYSIVQAEHQQDCLQAAG